MCTTLAGSQQQNMGLCPKAAKRRLYKNLSEPGGESPPKPWKQSTGPTLEQPSETLPKLEKPTSNQMYVGLKHQCGH